MIPAMRIQAYMRASVRLYREIISVPPFTLYLHPGGGDEDAGFAIPDVLTHCELRVPLARVEEHCRRRGLPARIRTLDVCAPELDVALRAHGYALLSRYPVLWCHADALVLPAEVHGSGCFTVTAQSSHTELEDAWNVNARGFDPDAPPATDEDIALFRHNLAGGLALVARMDGRSVSTGMMTVIRAGVTELVGITTLPAYRRRGLASLITGRLADAAFARGADLVFLIAKQPDAGRLYARAGFRPCATLVAYEKG